MNKIFRLAEEAGCVVVADIAIAKFGWETFGKLTSNKGVNRSLAIGVSILAELGAMDLIDKAFTKLVKEEEN